MNKTIYIGDSDSDFLYSNFKYFEIENFNVKAFTKGDALLEAFISSPCDFLIMDESLQNLGGKKLSNIIRDFSSVPIILTSSIGDELDKIQNIDLGCDDYILKPVSSKEIITRVKSIFRRIDFEKNNYPCQNVIGINNLILDLSNHQARIEGHDIKLTNKEFEVLKYLIENKHRAIHRDELLRNVWHFTRDLVDTRAIDDCIKRLRKKLTTSFVQVETVRGFGFKIVSCS